MARGRILDWSNQFQIFIGRKKDWANSKLYTIHMCYFYYENVMIAGPVSIRKDVFADILTILDCVDFYFK